MEGKPHPLVRFTAFILGLLWMLWLAWCTLVAFAGGKLPIPFVTLRVSGGIGLGLVWLLVIDPILATVGLVAFPADPCAPLVSLSTRRLTPPRRRNTEGGRGWGHRGREL